MKFLVATDGSAYAQHAIEQVADLCRRLKEESEVLLLYVKDVGSMALGGPLETGAEPFFDVEQTRQALDQSAEAALQGGRQVLEASGALVRTLTSWGRPAEAICEAADAEAVDLIVVGSSGMGQITGIFLGSVSDRVVHRAKQPVLVVRLPHRS